MAALPYMQLYVADYLADTMHLSVDQHGAYMLLIMNYWQTGKPLPDVDQRLQCVCRTSAEHWQEIRPALEEFFVIEDGYWHHNRIDADLEKVLSKSDSARRAAKKRHKPAPPAQESCERSANAEHPHMQTGCHTDTDTDTDTEIKTCAPEAAPIEESAPDVATCAIAYLNQRAGRNYQPVQSSTSLINARVKEGATISDITAVIDRKCVEWLGDPKFEQYLRPSTLFNATKFNDYLGQVSAPIPANDSGGGNEKNRTSGSNSDERLTRQLTDLEYARENF